MRVRNQEIATFAGGCFWCVEAAFESLSGVTKAINGYAGGHAINPTYQDVCQGTTGHAEAVQVHFNPRKITYQKLLDTFFNYIDPTDAGGQYVDRGSQYRTIIFYHSNTQKQLALEKISSLEKSDQYHKPIVTTIEPFTNFYEAEDYHQDFYKKSPQRYQQYKSHSGRPIAK